MNCENCFAECCNQPSTVINLNLLDLAKILETIKDYEIRINDQGFGKIRYHDRTIIITTQEIKNAEWHPTTYITSPCPFLKDYSCILHEQEITNSPLINTLKKNGYTTRVKPMICRHHPYYYLKGEVYKLEPCNQFHNSEKSTNQEIIKEAETILPIEQALQNHYQKTSNYPVIILAQELINGRLEIKIKKEELIISCKK